LEKELEEEVDPSRIVFGMSLGVSHDEEEDGGLTRAVKSGNKVSSSYSLISDG
jgi:hypothetical protein